MSTTRQEWSPGENRSIVQVYFEMLAKEQAGRSYIKIDYNRRVQGLTGRTKGSVERKFSNISSYLEDMNLTYIRGYKPLPNKQRSLKTAIDDYIKNNPGGAKSGGRHKDIERLNALLEETKQVILYGPPGTGKTLLARDCIAKFVKEGGGSCSEFVTFHQSFAYEEFVEGIRPSVDASGQVQYDVRPGVFRRICERASADPDKKYLLVIDELNRGNIAKIMGELITLIEKDKRIGTENALEVTLPYSGDQFGVPSNLYILGTMNTADRSIALLDAAIRRRFSFIECPPDPSLLAGEKVDGIDLQKLLSNINERVSWLVDRDHRIGHSYLMGISDLSQLKRAWEQQIMPLLNEYFYNSWDRLEAVVGRGTFWETKAMTPKTKDALRDFVDDGDEVLEPKILTDEDFLAVMIGLSS